MVNTLFQKLRRKNPLRDAAWRDGTKGPAICNFGFQKGIFHYLITTDVAARGIDLSEVTHVISYDFPTKRENYVHRISRTGRNGRTGKAFSFISKEEEHYKRKWRPMSEQ